MSLTLALLAFIQAPGTLVADTKFDLVVDPGRFLSRATQMWDQVGAFGQIQNQAYGYFIPMGPFFWLGDVSGLDMWVVQRLWWTLLLNVAFWGVWQVCRSLRICSTVPALVAATVYALGTHITTVIGGASVEVWPSAVAPWVLWALIRGSQGGSERRWGAVAALFVVACGGVNATAVSAVLPLGVIWLLTRSGRRRWVLLAWWTGFTVLGTLWWLVPLLLMGHYSFPFLDYIENAPITTMPTDLFHVLSGSSNWVAYVDPQSYRAGSALLSTPFLVLEVAAVVALGLLGCSRRDTPHRQFLLASIAVGVTLVGLGYAGPGHGLAEQFRQSLLDGALSPLRNVHKFDAVLRLPLALGVAHACQVWTRSRRAEWGDRMVPAVAALVLFSTLSPWAMSTLIAPTGPVFAVPTYWKDVARYLNTNADGGRVLVLPASTFGNYTWGWPKDDIMQAVMASPWGVRNVIPLAQPGNVVLLDAITEAVESGGPTDGAELAQVLADNGISKVLVRNDLDRNATLSPDGVVVRTLLEDSVSFGEPVGFGPTVGLRGVRNEGGNRIALGGGLSAATPAVQVFDVRPAAARARQTSAVGVVAGSPGSALRDGTGDLGLRGPRILAGQTEPSNQPVGSARILTDALRLRETSFADVRDNVSSTMASTQRYRLNRTLHTHQFLPNQQRWSSTMTWTGIRGVTASSSRAWADSSTPIDRGTGPEAVLDGDRATEWISNAVEDRVGEWWQADLRPGTVLDEVRVSFGSGTGVSRIKIDNGERSTTLPAGKPNSTRSYELGFGPSDRLRITAAAAAPVDGRSTFALAEVSVPGLAAQRYLTLPEWDTELTGIALNRDAGRNPCTSVDSATVCRPGPISNGDDGDTLARQVSQADGSEAADPYTVRVSGSLRPRAETSQWLLRQLPFEMTTTGSATSDPRGSPLAIVDSSSATTWISEPGVSEPRIDVDFGRPVLLGTLGLQVNSAAPASHPTRLELRTGDGRTRQVSLSRTGHGQFGSITVQRLSITVVGFDPTYDNSVSEFNVLPVGISDLTLSGPESSRNLLDTSQVQIDERCGAGPSIRIGSETVQTSFSGSLEDVVAGAGELAPCTAQASLASGRTRILARPTETLRVDRLTLQRPAPEADVLGVDAEVGSWSNQRRVVQVTSWPDPTLLSVAENANPGWTARLDGEKLRPVMVDGWRQGWWVPANSAGDVVLSFTPQHWFNLGLGVGAAGLLVLLAAALTKRRHDANRPAAAAAPTSLWWWLAFPVLTAMWAGWPGLAIAVIVAILSGKVPKVGLAAPWLAATTMVVAGAVVAFRVSETPGLFQSSWIQWGLVLGLSLAVFGAGEKPRFRSRLIGRSSR